MSALALDAASAGAPRFADIARYWAMVLPNWAYQVFHNGYGILNVLDITRRRPMPAGLVSLDHPWVTGTNPSTGRKIWHDNVVFRTARDPAIAAPDDDAIITATGRFLADRVRQSATLPEIPRGPGRRMPHGINYIHGSSHYNSGILVFNDLGEGYRHVTDARFAAEVRRFVREQDREVLFIFRQRDYSPLEYGYFSCCMRTVFPWFCNPNGPRDKVLWGNAAPFPSANLITGRWINDVQALREPGGASRVARPALPHGRYFRDGGYGEGRGEADFPERLLALATHWRVRFRDQRAGMFFVDRRQAYADQIAKRARRGKADKPLARI
jgi:hypothetical protein